MNQEHGVTDRSLMLRLGFSVFLSMDVMVLTMFLWSQTPGGAQDPRAALLYDLARYGCLILTTMVIWLLCEPLLADAWSAIRQYRLSMSVLLFIGILAAYGYSLASVLQHKGDVYFEVPCMVLVVTTLGRWFEATGRQRTTLALRALEGLLPTSARRLTGGQESLVAADSLGVGDVIRVLPGERVPVDGRIVRHRASFDLQAITGESLPVVCDLGDLMFAGAVSIDGEIWIEASSTADQGFLRQTIDAILRGAATKTRFQRLADRVSAVFFPVVVAIAGLTLLAHWHWHGFQVGWMAAIAVLVIACPCALGLATPMALWAAVGRAAQLQVVVRDTEGFLQLGRTTRFAFDKTGTLTTGVAKVSDFQIVNGQPASSVLAVAGGLARASTHPLAIAIQQFAEGKQADRWDVTTRVLAGKGTLGTVAGMDGECHLGSRRWLREIGYGFPADAAEATGDGAEVFLGWGGQLQAVFRCCQDLRADAVRVLDQLQTLGSVTILTGDSWQHAREQLPNPSWELQAEMLPEDKAGLIAAWTASGQRVVMIGDGINDGPAVASATVGVALGCGMDLSRASAGICLLSNDLNRLPQMIEFSRAVNQTVRWNLLWAFAYNILGIGLAAFGMINPVIAAIVMVVSSLLVVTNSLRLAHWQPTHGPAFERASPNLPTEMVGSPSQRASDRPEPSTLTVGAP